MSNKFSNVNGTDINGSGMEIKLLTKLNDDTVIQQAMHIL